MVPPGGAGTMTLKGYSPNAQALSASDHPISTMAGRLNCCSFIRVSPILCSCRTDCRRREYPAQRRLAFAYLGLEFVEKGQSRGSASPGGPVPEKSHFQMHSQGPPA
jgi:hypothetical protein